MPASPSLFGRFIWVDLATPDLDAAKSFYSELLGWTMAPVAAAEAGGYTIAQVRGVDVAALYPQGEAQRSQRLPPHWLSYVAVESAAAASERARALGGKVLMPAFDVLEAGSMALVRDRGGATLALWQPRRSDAESLAGIPGTLAWSELITRDVDGGGSFYSSLFGWQPRVSSVGGAAYVVFTLAERPVAGLMPPPKSLIDLPPSWLVYFDVDGCDRAAERARALGGTVLSRPTDLPSVGHFAVLRDPHGAIFAVIERPRSTTWGRPSPG